MENTNNSTQAQQDGGSKLTPHELIKKRMQNPDNPISDADLSNLKVGSDAEEEDKIKDKVNRKLKEIKRHTDDKNLLNPFSVLDESQSKTLKYKYYL